MPSPPIGQDFFRCYDSAIYDWLGGLTVDYGKISGRELPNQPI